MAGNYSIGSTLWPGLSKLIEEAGETQQVCGKLIGSGGNPAHWDGSDLKIRLEEEIGDLIAACNFVIARNGLDRDAIDRRVQKKVVRFDDWHDEEIGKKGGDS